MVYGVPAKLSRSKGLSSQERRQTNHVPPQKMGKNKREKENSSTTSSRGLNKCKTPSVATKRIKDCDNCLVHLCSTSTFYPCDARRVPTENDQHPPNAATRARCGSISRVRFPTRATAPAKQHRLFFYVTPLGFLQFGYGPNFWKERVKDHANIFEYGR